MILGAYSETSVLWSFHIRVKALGLGWYFSLSTIVRCDTGAEISQTAIDGLWRGAVFSFLLWAKFRSCSHLCWCQPPQQDDHQSRWCHCYLTVHIITSEVKWESYCASLLRKKNSSGVWNENETWLNVSELYFWAWNSFIAFCIFFSSSFFFLQPPIWAPFSSRSINGAPLSFGVWALIFNANRQNSVISHCLAELIWQKNRSRKSDES